MKIFISYSTGDLDLVKRLARQVEAYANPVYWDKSKEPGSEAWPKIFEWISSADLVVAVITDKTVSRAMAVGNEIGRAKTLGKLIIPLVAEGVPDNVLGCLQGVTYVRFGTDPQAALREVERKVAEIKKSKDFWTTVLVVGLFCLGLFLLTQTKKPVRLGRLTK